MCEQVLENVAVFQMNGSGWTFQSFVGHDVHTVKYKPLRGVSWVPLPKFLADKKPLINMKNKDPQCFKWCVARELHPVTVQLTLKE